MKKIYTLIFTISLFCFRANVQAQAPACTMNVSPADASVNLDPYPYITLKWNPVAGATSYDVYLSTKVPPDRFIGNATSDSFNFINASYNTTYHWYVVPKNANGSPKSCSSSATSFTTIPPAPPPSNDDCTGATNLSAMPLNGTTVGATQSQPADLCSGYTGTADDDVWYQFTPTSNGTIVITMAGNGSFDGVLEAFSGSCGSLTSLTCSDTSQAGGREQITMNVTSGTNYKIRIYGFYSDLSSRGTFSVSATGVVLPVSLLNFRGEHSGNNNLLSWSTVTELNNQGFELQYSSDGNNFEDLSFINSKAINGNSSSILNYEFADRRTLSGNAYYRLKQVDKDGHASFSNIILLKGDKINALMLGNIYPNPTKNKMTVTIASPMNNKINLQIRDIAGKVVLQQAATVFNGDNNLPVDVSSLPSGNYFIKAITNNGTATAVSKFVKE